MNIESWCTVEKMPSQDWRRAQRGHHDGALNSTVFKEDNIASQQDRFSYGKAVQETKHKEKRHYPEKCNENQNYFYAYD